jgi:hypothetical protein
MRTLPAFVEHAASHRPDARDGRKPSDALKHLYDRVL